MDNNLTIEEQERIKRETEESNKLEEILLKARQLYDERNFLEAKPLIEEYIERGLVLNKEDEQHRFFSFNNISEFFYATKKLKIQKNIVWTSLKFSYAYFMLAFISFEEQEYDKAVEYCDKAIYYNPLDLKVYFEKIESFKSKKDFETMFNLTKETYEYIFDNIQLARYYRLLGYYYTEIKKYDIAYSLYLISLHFDRNNIAYNEIEYIKKQLNNPSYIIETEKALELFKQEGIPFGISEENKNIIVNLTNDKTIIEHYPNQIEKANEILKIIDKPIESAKELLNINISKITTEDIFDENKIILDELDKARQKKNIELIKNQNIPFIEGMQSVPINSVTTLKTKEEIIKRMLGDYVISYFCILSLNYKFDPQKIINEMDQKLNIKTVLSSNDLQIVNDIIDKKMPIEMIKQRSWLIEGCAVLMWVLGLLDKPNSDKQCDLDQITNILIGCSSYEDLVLKCNLRSKEEIMEFDDLLIRYRWACRQARIKNIALPQLNESIIQEQNSELDWVLDFELTKIMKKVIEVKFEKEDIRFKFKTQSKYNLDQIDKFNDLLFSLKYQTSMISIFDLGKCIPNDFNNNCQLDLEQEKINGWDTIKEFKINSINFDHDIKQVILKGKMDSGYVGMINYYFLLCGHIMRMSVILSENVNFDDENSLMNDPNNSDAISILFSITEGIDDKKPAVDIATDMAKNMNYRLHAEQLNIPILNFLKVEESQFPQVILFATGEGFLEQFISDGFIEEGEFENRINIFINSIKKEQKTDFFYFKDYSNGTFNFKLYFQDLYIEDKIVRVINAFFVEPKMHDLYQLTLSAGPFNMPTEMLKPGIIDLENDKVTLSLNNLMMQLLNELKYKDSN